MENMGVGVTGTAGGVGGLGAGVGGLGAGVGALDANSGGGGGVFNCSPHPPSSSSLSSSILHSTR